MTTPAPGAAVLGAEFAAAAAAINRTWMTPDLAPLADALTVALVEMGFTLHQCREYSPGYRLGGVCITPVSQASGGPGLSVSWAQHDRRAHWQYGPDLHDDDTPHTCSAMATYGRGYRGVQDTMNYALQDALSFAGFTLRSWGEAGATLVTAAPDPGFGEQSTDDEPRCAACGGVDNGEPCPSGPPDDAEGAEQ